MMGGGAARSSAGKRAPTTNHNIMASSAKVLQLHTGSKALVGMTPGRLACSSSPTAVPGCHKHRYVLVCQCSHLPLQPRRLSQALHREQDMLLCLFPLQHTAWGRHVPALLLPSFLPGAFHHFPKLGWLFAKQSITSTGREAAALVSCEEGADFPLPFLPPLQPRLALLRACPGPRGRKTSLLLEVRSRCRCKAAASRRAGKTSLQRPGTSSKDQNSIYLCRAAQTQQPGREPRL